MTTRTADWLSLIVIGIAALTGIGLYGSLPDEVPTHWNAAGEVDDYTDKFWAVVIFPLIAALIWALFKVIPVISPKGYRTSEFPDVVNRLQVTIVGFTSGISLLVLLEAAGMNMHIDSVIPVAVGLLLIFVGNYLGKVRKNFFIGIRTPWTLASDEVWYRTHRLGGRLFVAAGFVLMLGVFFERYPIALAGIVVVLAFIPVVYSYLLYRREEGFDETTGDDDGS